MPMGPSKLPRLVIYPGRFQRSRPGLPGYCALMRISPGEEQMTGDSTDSGDPLAADLEAPKHFAAYLSPRVVLPLFVAASFSWAAVDGILNRAMQSGELDREYWTFLMGISIGQHMLLATWAALGPGRFLVRQLCALVAVLIYWVIVEAGFYGDLRGLSSRMLIFHTSKCSLVLYMQVPYWIMRAGWSWKIRRQPLPVTCRERRFSIAQLFACVAVCAVLFAVARFETNGLDPDAYRDLAIVVALGAVLVSTAPALAALAIVVPTSHRLRRRAVGYVVFGNIGFFIGAQVTGRSDLPLSFLGIQAGFLISYLASLLLIRMCGYRLVTGANAQ